MIEEDDCASCAKCKYISSQEKYTIKKKIRFSLGGVKKRKLKKNNEHREQYASWTTANR